MTFTWAGPAPHGVVRTSGEICPGVDAANDVELAPTAPTGTFVWEAREAGVYWVACPVPGHCFFSEPAPSSRRGLPPLLSTPQPGAVHSQHVASDARV